MISIIPARSGSKGIIDKNIQNFNGKPLIAWTIEQSLQCKQICDTYVSTDSKNYALISEKFGAKVPFLRPSNISKDLSTDYEFVNHFINNTTFEYKDIIQLRPTFPIRKSSLITSCIDTYYENYNEIDSLRTVTCTTKSPFKMYTIDSNKKQLIPLFETFGNIKQPYNQCRQILPDTYLHNGCIDIFKKSTIYEHKNVTGEHIYPYVMNEHDGVDIDIHDDWKLAENILMKNLELKK